MTPEILRAHRKVVKEVRIFYFPASQTGFSRSFSGEIPAAILFPSAALSSSPCVYSRSIVGTEKRTLLRSSPILTPQAPLTTNMHCRGKYKYSHNNKLLIFTCSFKKKVNYDICWGSCTCFRNVHVKKVKFSLKKSKKLIPSYLQNLF